jgi:hypothetical protein
MSRFPLVAPFPFPATLALPNCLFALFAVFALLTASPAWRQAGWTVFDSREAIPASSGLAFTIKYHPVFSRVADLRIPDSIITGLSIYNRVNSNIVVYLSLFKSENT